MKGKIYKLINVSLVTHRDEYEKKSGSHRTASVTNSYYWLKLASKRKYECRFSFTTKLDTIGNS